MHHVQGNLFSKTPDISYHCGETPEVNSTVVDNQNSLTEMELAVVGR